MTLKLPFKFVFTFKPNFENVNWRETCQFLFMPDNVTDAFEVKGTKRKSEASKNNTHGCQRQPRFESMQNGDPHGKKRYRNLMPALDAVLHIS